MIGVNRMILFYYPTVRALMTQAASENKQQREVRRFQKREEDLTQLVVNAIQHYSGK